MHNIDSVGSIADASLSTPILDEVTSVRERKSKKKTGKSVYTAEEVLRHDKPTDAWIIVDGRVYDVTKWIPFHPGGGLIIRNVAGRDVSDAFNQFHPNYVTIKKLPNYYIGDLDNCELSPFNQAYKDLQLRIEKEGFYETSYAYYAMKTLICFAMWVGVFYLFIEGNSRNSFWMQLAGAVLQGVFYQQSAFLGHDTGHNGISHNRTVDSLYGLLVGNLMNGVSMAWWKDSHNVHHTVPNHLQHDPDIQHLPVFAVHSDYFKSLYSFYHSRVMVFDRMARWLVSYQHYLFYPVMAVARINLYAQSWILVFFKENCEWRKSEIAAMVFFWIWSSWLYSFSLSWSLLFVYFMVTNAVSGILHVQICLSHFAMATYDELRYKNQDEQFFETQLETTMDIDNPRYMDWFHGGLQFQTAHHLFPRVPRHNLRALRVHVQDLCRSFGKTYNLETFLDANILTIKCLKKAALQAREGNFVSLKNTMIWDGLHAKG